MDASLLSSKALHVSSLKTEGYCAKTRSELQEEGVIRATFFAAAYVSVKFN